MKKTLVTLVSSLLVVLLFVSPGFATASITQPAPAGDGDTAPDFSLETLDGRRVALADHRGKKVVLFFFTTWCPYCVRKFPALEKRLPELTGEGVVLLPINAGESQAKVASFREKRKIAFDILLDTSASAARAYGVFGVPTFILIGADGSVLYEGNDLPSNYREIFEEKR